MRLLAAPGSQLIAEEQEAFAGAPVYGTPAEARAWLERGVEVNALLVDDAPPLTLAAARGHRQVLTLLLNAGAVPRVEPHRDGSSLCRFPNDAHEAQLCPELSRRLLAAAHP